MTDPTPTAATIVFNRFGLGARAADLAKVGSDPRGFLKAELRPDAALIGADAAAAAGLAGTTANLQAAFAAGDRPED